MPKNPPKKPMSIEKYTISANPNPNKMIMPAPSPPRAGGWVEAAR